MCEPPPHSPRDWNFNPSSWGDRFPIIALAATGLVIAVYLGLYQIGVLHKVWEPFYGRGSEVILRETPIARILPDAFVGAGFYLIEFVLSLIGGSERWRTRPWAVLAQGVVSIGLAIAGIVLAIIQPTLFGHYCTMCLASAACSVFMVGFALTEALAALQYLARVRGEGGSFNGAVWGQGGPHFSRSHAAPINRKVG